MELSTKELGQYLRTIREQLGYSVYDVNKLCEISPSYLSLLENGKRRPSAIILKKLAPIYNLDYIDLYEKAGYIDLIEDEKNNLLKKIGATPLSDMQTVSIPLLGTVKAGYDYLAQENWIGTIDVDKKLADKNDLFALKVKGDSMFPVLVEDDIVIVKKQNDFENGDIVVAIINGDEATIKKGKKLDNGIKLIPFNRTINPSTGEPLYDDKTFTYDEMESIPVIIVGIVKQLKREF